MADLNQSVEFVLRQEDSAMSGKVTASKDDTGGRTRYGLAERWHPELTTSGYFGAMPNEEALALAKTTYATMYGGALGIVEIEHQQVADRFLSFAVNEGPVQATKLMQQAMCQAGKTVVCDGHAGPATLSAINAVDPGVLVIHLRAVQSAFYLELVKRNPSQQRFLTGWLRRANA